MCIKIYATEEEEGASGRGGGGANPEGLDGDVDEARGDDDLRRRDGVSKRGVQMR